MKFRNLVSSSTKRVPSKEGLSERFLLYLYLSILFLKMKRTRKERKNIIKGKCLGQDEELRRWVGASVVSFVRSDVPTRGPFFAD